MSQAAIVKVENGQVKVFNSAGAGISSFRVGSGPSEAVSVFEFVLLSECCRTKPNQIMRFWLP